MTFMNFKSFLMTPFKTLFLSQLKSLSKCISHALMPFWIFFCCAELCSNNTLIVFPNVCLTSFASKHDHLLQIIGLQIETKLIFSTSIKIAVIVAPTIWSDLFFFLWGGIFYVLHQLFVDFQTLFWYVSLLQTSWD